MTTAEKKENKTIFVGLSTKLIVVLALLFVLAFVGIFVWLDNFVTDLMMNSLRRDLIATATTGADAIDGDKHTALYESGQIDNADYTAIADILRAVKSVNPKASGVYTYVHDPKDESYIVRFVVSAALPPGSETTNTTQTDASLTDCQIPPSSRPGIGDPYSDTSPQMVAGVYQAGSDDELWKDDWGTWLSGYAPIHNAAGEPVGAVGVDMCAAEVIRLQENIRRNTLYAMGGTVIVLIVIVGFIAAGVTRPVSQLTHMADRIGAGDYEVDFSRLYSTRIQDEVDKLASVFELMVSKVYTREKDLRARVQQLEIMIDEGKRDKQVQEIVESDFFRDLQDKAQAVRERDEKARKKEDKGKK